MSAFGGGLLPYELYVDNTYAPAKIFTDVTVGNPTGTSAAASNIGGQGGCIQRICKDPYGHG